VGEVFVEEEQCLGDDVLDPIFPVIREPIENSGLSAIDQGPVPESALLAHELPLSLNSNGW
jgi:predicted dinucleotide-binding enzyme